MLATMNIDVASAIRDPDCTACKHHGATDVVCQVGEGPAKAKIMVVSRMPNTGNFQKSLEEDLVSAGLDPKEIYFASALKCRTFGLSATATDIKTCKVYLHKEIELVKPKWILTLGNEALSAVTGHSGVTKYRGRIIELAGGSKVVPTISPSAVNRNPGQRAGYIADLNFFTAQVTGKASKEALPKIRMAKTIDDLKTLIKDLKQAELMSYDIETNGFDEFDSKARIVSLAVTLVSRKDGKRKVKVWAVPLYHPESPFFQTWRSVVKQLGKHMSKVPKQVAHNGKFDARWLRHHGSPVKVTFDTMLAAHLLDENRSKGLKPLARMLLGVPPWDVNTANLLKMPMEEVLTYNALDTYYTYQVYRILRKQLIKQPRLMRLFMFLIMPANEELIEIERHGVWIDRTKLTEAIKISFDMRDEIDRQLMEWVPKPESKKVRKAGGWPTDSKGKPVEINFNPSNFSKWWLFEVLKLPVIARGKPKDDGSPGLPSMSEAVMLELRATEHPVVKLLMERSKWQKYCSTYVTRYDEMADTEDRIHTTFKLAGTVTGRLSSGKVDQEKVTGRTNIRGVNLQQVPRDPFIRGLFGAPPGYRFIEADYSQVELRVVAFLARDPTMMGIYQRGEDIHRATAAWVLGVPESKVSKDDRKKAKAVNFGFVYGMGWKKFISTAFEKYDVVFTEEEARAVRAAFFERFSTLQSWHARQRRLVHSNQRVQSPLGRVRHLPDIMSGDQPVVAEAERQAINSPVQALASDMNLLSMVLVCRQFREQGIRGVALGTVHDATNYEVHEDDVAKALPVIKDTMENLPLFEYFGLELDVPMIADLKVGTHWGGARELSPEEVYNWKE